ncbi:MAG: chromate transporter [Rectinemataceae bacterium]
MKKNTRAAPPAPTPTPTPIRLFWQIARINSITLGGGYVIVPVTATVFEKKGWMEEKEFYDVFARAQAFPGPIALSTSILTSLRLCGWKGAVAAFFGVVLPPFAAIILVSGLIGRYGSLPAVKRFLAGAGAVVPGLIAAMVWKTASKRNWTASRVFETLAVAIVLILFPAYSLLILLVAISGLYCIEGPCKRSR